MQRTQRSFGLLGPALGLALAGLMAGPAMSQVVPKGDHLLNSLSFTSERLNPLPASERLDDVRAMVAQSTQGNWEAFQLGLGSEWHAYIDKRSGHVEYAEGPGIPFIPGRGNQMQMTELAAHLGGKQQVDLAVMESVAREFLPRIAPALGVNAQEMVLDSARSGQVADYLWYLTFDVHRGGVLVEGARVTFTVNNGNLIQIGTLNIPPASAKVPPTNVTAEQARKEVSRHIGGFQVGDHMIDRGTYVLLPAAVLSATAPEGYEFGKGRGLVAVYQFKFKRDGVMGTWRGRVDASTGKLLDFFDINEYALAQVTGGAYGGDRPAPEQVVAMPWANVSSGGFANSAGLFTWNGTVTTTSLNGQYVKITDSCGAISKGSDASGNIALGSGTGTDCTTPGSGGAGDTHSARTQFYNVNRIKERGRSWLPSNTWLQGQINVKVNLNQTCNAYWDGVALNFFKSGGGCNNTGELPGVSLHEFGHGLDSNDGNSDPPDNGSGEATGDWTAALQLHASCTGNGFLSSNCGGYGDACTACTGVRDIDWAKHASNTPSTVQNFTKAKCPQPSANNPNYVGPCGKDAIARGNTTNKREGHCESLVATQAQWDFVNRDLPSPGSGSAWTIADRLWYLSRSTSTAAFQCNTSAATWTSDGCNTGSWWRTMRAVDDDDGNLTNGTPHSCNLFAAFNRHGIACSTDTGANTCFAGCTPPPTPVMTLTPGDNQVTVSWTGTAGSYNVFRNERGCSAGFVKISSANTGTSFVDTGVANGTTYYYQMVGQPAGNEACGSAPATCTSVVPAAGVTPDFAISASPTSVSIVQGNSAPSTITTTVSGGFNNAIALSATGMPSGVTVGFSPTSIAAPGAGSSTMTITVAAGTATGTSTITVTGTGGSTTHNTTVSLTVTSAPVPDFTISAAPSSVSVVQGNGTNSTITTAVSGGFNSAIALSATGQPTGVTVAFSPTSIAAPGSGTSSMSITVGATTTLGTYPITVTGTGGSLTHNTTVNLTVTSSGGGGGTATYDATLKAPECSTVGISCDSGAALLLGRGTKGPEPNQPNTINNSCADGTSGTFHSDESNDRLKVSTTDASNFAAGKTVKVEATVWAYSGFTSDHLDLYYAPNATSPVWTLIATLAPTVAGSQVLSANYTLPTGGSLQAVRANFRYTGSASSCSTGAYDDHDDLVFAVSAGAPDTTPPTTAITAPTNGATVAGTVNVTASASDNVGVTRVEIYIDSVLKSTINASPYTYSWNTTTVANGSHSIFSKAYDAANNVGTSTTVSVTVSNSTAQQLLGNPGFENGSGSPAPWVPTAGVIDSSTSQPSHTGTWKAWLDGYGSAHTDTLLQAVTIPAGVTTATLSFWLHIDSADTSTTLVHDTMSVQIRNSSGTVLSTLATYSNLNKATGYSQKSFDVSAFKGQAIQVFFTATENTSLQTSFVVDDTALNTQ